MAILGEFDALPGLSQKKGLTQNEPISAGGHGHGCGHNLLGTGAFAAAVSIKEYMQANRFERNGSLLWVSSRRKRLWKSVYDSSRFV